VATNGREAVEVYRAQAESIDLVIMDVVMPVMGGLDAYKAIAADDPSARVLFTSGYYGDDPRGEGFFDANDAFLAKPSSPPILLQKVRDMLSAPELPVRH
jgi:CheY-like chemotaxis protein